MNYDEFLHSKVEVAPVSGFEVRPEDINPALKPHQRDAVMWAVKGGRRALFESFGLGKTAQELEWCRPVTQHEGGKALIVLPLGVRQEFTRDAAELLHINPPVYVRNMEEVRAAQADILMTNYIELNSDYFRDSVGYLRAEEVEIEQPSLFDLLDQEEGA